MVDPLPLSTVVTDQVVEDPSDKALESEISAKPPGTLPRYDPHSPVFTPPHSPSHSSSGAGARLKVRLARLQLEAQDRERQAEYNFRLEIRRLEMEQEVSLRRLELEAESAGRSSHTTSTLQSPPGQLPDTFDVRKNIALVPQFCESEVDSYFGAFERITASLRWPKDV